MAATSKVAILLATYNGDKYIDALLGSIATQTFNEITCYIHDDGSDDNTLETIKNYCDKYPNLFVNLDYKNTQKGAMINFMSLVKYASKNIDADYYMFCDQDDIWEKDKVYDQIKAIDEHCNKNGPALTYCDQILVDDGLNEIHRSVQKMLHRRRSDDDFRKIIFRNTAAGCSMLFNRELLRIASMIENDASLIMHDWWIMLVASYFGNVYYLNKPLVKYRQHDNNALGVDNNDWIKKTKLYLSDFNHNYRRRKEHFYKCITQVVELQRLNIYVNNTAVMNRFLKIMKSPIKLYRLFFLIINGYISRTNLALCLFV